MTKSLNEVNTLMVSGPNQVVQDLLCYLLVSSLEDSLQQKVKTLFTKIVVSLLFRTFKIAVFDASATSRARGKGEGVVTAETDGRIIIE